MSNRIRHGCVVGLFAWSTILAGCVPARAWSDHTMLRTNGQVSAVEEPGADVDLAALRAEVIEAHNRIRADAKLPPLTISGKLQAAAERHANDMAAHGKMTHKGSDGSTVVERI